MNNLQYIKEWGKCVNGLCAQPKRLNLYNSYEECENVLGTALNPSSDVPALYSFVKTKWESVY